MQRSRLVALVSRDGEKARRLASQHDVAQAYDNLEECLANPEVEAVYIATPPANHLREVETVASAKRHVLCEKPLATTASEAAEMVAICARQSVLLMTAYRKCFEPSTVLLILTHRLAMTPAEWLWLKLAAERIGAARLLTAWRVGPMRGVPSEEIAREALRIGEAKLNQAWPEGTLPLEASSTGRTMRSTSRFGSRPPRARLRPKPPGAPEQPGPATAHRIS